jgi:chorismate mutase-like protein
MDIEDWRKRIDELNSKLLALLNQRAQCALEIGKIKQATGQPVYAPDRETAVLNHLREVNTGPLSNDAVQRIFRQIIDESLRLEREHGEDG